MSRYVELSKALVTELASRLNSSVDVQRRLIPRRFRTEFEEGKTYVSVFAGASGHDVVGRQVDSETWEAVIAIQSAGPKPDPNQGDNPFGPVTTTAQDPIEWGDGVFGLVEEIKDFWRAESESRSAGPLRDLVIAGCVFMSLEHDPVYVPSHLEELGILSIVLQLNYRVQEDLE